MNFFTIKDGREIEIREAVVNDAAAIIAFGNKLFTSTDQVLRTLEEFNDPSLEQQCYFIESHNKHPNAILLVAMQGEQVVGLLNFNCNERKKLQHWGEFGVSVHPDFQQNGIAKKMILQLLEWASSRTQIEKIVLNVFDTNAAAIKLYEQLGFIMEGRQVKAARQEDNSYVDMICMAKFINR